jgi:hypothetical protein
MWLVMGFLIVGVPLAIMGFWADYQDRKYDKEHESQSA